MNDETGTQSQGTAFGRRAFLTKAGVLSASAALSSLPMAAAAQQAKSEHGHLPGKAHLTTEARLACCLQCGSWRAEHEPVNTTPRYRTVRT